GTGPKKLGVAKGEPLRGQFAGCWRQRLLAITDNQRAHPADLIEVLLRDRRLTPEEREHGHDAGGAKHHAEQCEHSLAEMAARLVEPGEDRLEDAHVTT